MLVDNHAFPIFATTENQYESLCFLRNLRSRFILGAKRLAAVLQDRFDFALQALKFPVGAIVRGFASFYAPACNLGVRDFN